MPGGRKQLKEPHRSQGAWGAVVAEPLAVGVTHSIFGGSLKLHAEPGEVTFGVNHSRNEWLVSHQVAACRSWEQHCRRHGCVVTGCQAKKRRRCQEEAAGGSGRLAC